jgi:putative ABC transport system substrate-binding protein
MHRRQLLGIGLAAAAPIPASAQPQRMPTVTYLVEGEAATLVLPVIRDTLRKSGWVEGQNLRLKLVSVSGHSDGLAGALAEAAREAPDVLVVNTTHLAEMLLAHTTTTPIVVLLGGALSREQNVASLARPGGNVTGMQALSDKLMGKRLQLLQELDPKIRTVAVLRGAHYVPSVLKAYHDATDVAAKRLNISLNYHGFENASELPGVFDRIINEGNKGLLVWGNPHLGAHFPRIHQLTLERKVPSICELRAFVGALLAYGPAIPQVYVQPAMYIDRILRGARPGDLPVLQPTTFDFTVNLKTARAIGITVPTSLLAGATEVIPA